MKASPTKMPSIFSHTPMRRSYAFGSLFLIALLFGCSVALISLVMHWNRFTAQDGTMVRFPVEGLNGLKVERTATLLWSCVLVMPLCFTGIFLLCFRRKFMILLMILTGVVALSSSVYASANFNAIYNEIQTILAGDEDSFDKRCDSRSINNVNYCECKVGSLYPSVNGTTSKVLRFRVDECDDLEDVTMKFFIFFCLSLTDSLLSATLLITSLVAYCSPVKQPSNALLSNEASIYDSTKNQDDPRLYPNLPQTEGHHNPVFIQYTNTEPKKKIFWYPYSGEPNPDTQVGERPRASQPFEPNTQVTFSNFRNGQEGRVF